ncbi:MAG TPA: HK97-gp10 family putative phage morphogenesis protein [Devosia sp.]|jgi:HK97 gp10 family phage protein|nr:HK97-gp10 family putative phage morphogenesis protein [Devosia sp.]
MKVTVDFEGGKQLDDALGQFTASKRRAIGRVALDKAGEITAKSMRAKAPVEEGNLRESIDVSGSLTPSAKTSHTKGSDQERFIGPDSRPSAVTQEFGTVNHPPQPFARPAWDETKDEVLKRIGEELWLGIDKAAKAAAKKAARG